MIMQWGSCPVQDDRGKKRWKVGFAMGGYKKILEKIWDVFGKVRLLTVYYWILLTAVFLFLASLAITNSIAKKGVQEEYQEYNETLFEQAQTEMERSVKELIQIAYNIMSNRDVSELMSITSLGERSSLLEDAITPTLSNILEMKSCIASISLYNTDGQPIANIGKVYRNKYREETPAKISFSGMVQVGEKQYFEISVPLYDIEKTQIKGRCGSCYILIYMSYLDDMLEGRLPTSDSCFFLSSEDGEIMVQKGEAEELIQAEQPETAEYEQSIYQSTIEKTSWTLTLAVPNRTLYQNVNYMQRINGITYVIFGTLLFLLFLAIYASVLRPIREQTAFMNYYARNRKSRMTVRSHNEMGMLAENLNAMLDDIDRLTEENIRTKEKVLESDYQKKQSELLAYRNQINPHFLHNTFECIRGMALLYDVPDIAAITESLSSFFLYNIRGEDTAQIEEICAHVDDYASIIGYRFMNKYQILFDIEEEVKTQRMPKMILQPLVENAVFHALETKEEGGAVRVTMKKNEENRLVVQVRDNGCGMSEEEVEQLKNRLREYDRTNLLPAQKHGIGLVNIYRRLRLFYGDALSFSIHSKKGEGTLIEICVPMNHAGASAQKQGGAERDLEG